MQTLRAPHDAHAQPHGQTHVEDPRDEYPSRHRFVEGEEVPRTDGHTRAVLSIGPIPRKERHGDSTTAPERKLAGGIRGSKCAGEDDAPLTVVIDGLGGDARRRTQRVEAVDRSEE